MYNPMTTQVTHISENTTRREQAGHHLGCFYSGSVDGDPSSTVSVNLCHGMVSQRRNFRNVASRNSLRVSSEAVNSFNGR